MLENEALSSHPAEGGTPAVPYYWKSVDWDGLMRDYPPPPYFQQTTGKLSEQELRALQNTRFIARMEDAWRTPFYAMRWGAAGIEPGDIRSLDDIEKLPCFTSDDLKDAIAAAPPFGSHQPVSAQQLARTPFKVHTSGGTTGFPRLTLFDPVALEVQAIQTARGRRRLERTYRSRCIERHDCVHRRPKQSSSDAQSIVNSQKAVQ